MAEHEAVTIERREFKYLVAPELLPALRRALQGRCVLDRHAGPARRYPIRSLYLDTASLRLARANAAEASVRFKVRVRVYPGTAAPVFLEVKRRYGDVIQKDRTPVPLDAWPRLLDAPDGLSPGAERFADLVRSLDLRPVALVEYDREAYVSELDDYARVTFDFAIGCQRADDLTLLPRTFARLPIDHPGRTSTPEPRVVVELKLAGAAPGWMRALVERFDLQRHAFSKYVGSVEELSRMGDLGAVGTVGTGWT
jgi:hypothetical protein